MKLADELTSYLAAAFTGIWITTHEADEVQREIVLLARSKQWKIALWDAAHGLRLPGSNSNADTNTNDPLAALRALPALSDPEGTAILLLHNFHRFLTSADVVQTVYNQLIAGKQQRTFLVVLAPTTQIPLELEKLFVVIEHALPDREQLERIARGLPPCDRAEDLPTPSELERILDAAAGLTRYEAEGAFALSLSRHGRLVPQVIWDLKAQMLKKSRLLRLHRGSETFASLGGMPNLKDFCRRALQSGQSVKARGVLTLGVPGSGKSVFAKALGNETGRPTLLLDMGSLYGSLVGATEANIRQALQIADAMAPCILFCDEIDKGLAGVGGQGDSGVSTRLFGTLLTWLAEHESDVFFLGTANDIARLPPEFTRAERLDAVFFLDVPNVAEKDVIWRMYRQQFAIPEQQSRPDDTSWTGAEIRSCCRLATLLDITLHQAAQHVVPVAVTAAEAMDKLKTWASGRCLNAANPGIYTRAGQAPAKAGRRVQRPNDN